MTHNSDSNQEINLNQEEQFALVHQAIQAVASVCDGAVERDGQGFDGTDTKYGRRIASVPFATLTADDQAEEARIVLKYRVQVEALTGLDVATLPVVLDAQGNETNHNSRQNARDYERKARTAHLKDKRKATLLPSGKVALAWIKGDPDFKALLDAVKKLPGRHFNWTTEVNEVPATPAVLEFCDAWDINVPADVVTAATPDPEADEAPADTDANVFVEGGTVWIKAPYDSKRVVEARKLPGREWKKEREMDKVDPTPDVIRFAQEWNLTVSEEAMDLCSATGERPVAASQGRKALLRAASGAKSPADLPEGFLALLGV